MPFDPFADIEEPDEAQAYEELHEDPPFAEPTPTKEEKVIVAVPSEGKVVVTLKGASGYDAPWIVIHADDANDALSQLNDPNMVELIKKTSVMASGFQKTYKPGSAPASGGGSSNDRKPPVATQFPAGVVRKQCEHGDWVYKTWARKDGKGMNHAQECPVKDRNCGSEWINGIK